MQRKVINVMVGIFIGVVFGIAGCGEGGGTTPINVSAPTVSGTASEGALITGKIVTLKDANGKPTVYTITNATTGSYSIDVTGLAAPFLVMVTGTNGTYVSLAQTAGTANINPITTTVVALAAGNPDVSGLFMNLTPAQLTTIKTNYSGKSSLVTASLQTALPTGVKAEDYFTGTISAGKGMDALFDTYQIIINRSGITVKTKDANATIVLTIPAATVSANTNQPLPTIIPTQTSGFTTAMLSGNTFNDSNGAILTFNTNATFLDSHESTTNMKWSINSKGQILVVDGSYTTTVTFISGSLSTGLNYSVLNSDGTTNTGTLVPATAPTSSATTVGDPTTYLVWQKTDDNNKRNWNEAITYCDNLTLSGYNNWRLPSRDELKGLNYSSIFNQINGTYYAQVNDQYIGSYWSNTSFDNSQAYHVFLRSNAGSEGYANKSFYSNLVRCVRP